MTAAEILASIVKRIEAVRDRKAELVADERWAFAEAASAGYDDVTVRRALRLHVAGKLDDAAMATMRRSGGSIKPRRDWDGFVYFAKINDEDAVKVGFALDVSSRLRSLRNDFRREFSLVGAIRGRPRDEHMVHLRFRRQRVRGFGASREVYRWSGVLPQIEAILRAGVIQ